MKTVVAFGLICIIILGCAIALYGVRGGLDWLPGTTTLALDGPLMALPHAGGGMVILDKGGYRLLKLEDDKTLGWSSESSGLYGRIIALEADSSGNLYAIDQARDEDPAWRYERIVRIGADGKPAGVIQQKRVHGSNGFVSGALAVAGNNLWYLFADEFGHVSLNSVSLETKQERLIFKTEWSLPYAALAVDSSGEHIVVSAGGGLLRFDKGRFDLLSEYRSVLPYPSFIRYDTAGRLYASDVKRALVAELQDNGKILTRLWQSSSSFGQLTPLEPGAGRLGDFLDNVTGLAMLESVASPSSAVDYFSFFKDGFLTVDRYNNRVSFFDRQGVAGRVLQQVTLATNVTRQIQVAWVLLVVLVFFALLLLVLVLLKLIVLASPVPALLLACLPPLALMFIVVLVSLFIGGVEAVQAGQHQILAELKGTAKTAARFVSPTSLDGLRDTQTGLYDTRRLEPFGQLMKQLSSQLDLHANSLATIYGFEDGQFVLLADSSGVFLPGAPYRQLGAAQSAALAAGKAWAGIQRRPYGLSLTRSSPAATSRTHPAYALYYAAVMPLVSADGRLAGMIELSLPAVRPGVLLVLDQALARAGTQLWLLTGSGFLLLVSVAVFSALRLGSQERHELVSLPDVDSLMAPTERGAVHLPPDLELDEESRDEELNLLLDETRFGLTESHTGSSLNDPFMDTAEPQAIAWRDDPVPTEISALTEQPEFTELEPLPDNLGLAESTAASGATATLATSFPSSRPSAVAQTPAASDFRPEDHTLQHRQAIEALRQGDVDQAVVLLERLLDAFPADARAWNNLGIAYKRQGRLLMAIRSVEKALALDPENADTKKNLAALKQLRA
jgi:hypothetical protein